jgi:CheY-like chemotaxis protein
MSKHILVVEDQPDSRQIIRDMVAGTDYEITEAENGEEALAAIAKQRPDLILMDIQLPIMDGYTATRLIKTDPALRNDGSFHVSVRDTGPGISSADQARLFQSFAFGPTAAVSKCSNCSTQHELLDHLVGPRSKPSE